MKLIPSIFKNKETRQQQQQQPLQYWPSSCKQQPKTVSFRGVGNDVMFKTVNSVYFDPLAILETVETPESWFTKSSESSACSFSSESEEHILNSATASGEDSLEMILRGIRSSERLFFEPGDTSSILKEEAKINQTNTDTNDGLTFSPLKESVVLAMESEDPYVDFKSSMQEMVETHGLKDWESLEELLGWYLKMNGKKNHGFIVTAFVDLLLTLVSSSSSSSSDTENSSSSFLSASSSFSTLSSPLSSSSSAVQIQKERQQIS